VYGNRRVFVTGRGFANLDDLSGVSFEFNQQDDEIGYLISQSLQPLILKDASKQYPQYFNTGVHALAQIRGYMAVPIVLNQKLIGMITLDKNEPDFYKDQHARLAMAFSAQAATAINNARLFNETQQRNAELAIINSVQEGLASKLDVQAIYELVGDKIRETFNAQVVSIDTYDRDAQMLRGRYYFEAGKVLAGSTYSCFGFRRHVIENRQPIIIHKEMARWMEEYDNPVIQGLQPKSAIFIPMIVGEEAMGVISLQNNDQENAFTEADVRLLTTLANSMSIALENARLWEQEKLYRKALQRELEIGREIQAGFLPEELPLVQGWEIAASLMSAREVAGDFYDAFELPDGNIGLVIADVCDKGVGAALFMTLFRSLIRITANQEYFEHTESASASHSTAECLQRAMLLTNNYIAETHQDSGMFATIFFGILDPRNGKLTYINGGHEPPFIVQSGNVREALRKTGPAVGAILDCGFDAQVVQLDPGEMFFAFTDGASEAQDPHGEFFGREGLLDILRRCNSSAHELIKTTEAELHRYMDGTTQFDDITLLAVRRVP
jgi:serine phosphatase RsbU (regulator of sigma subunit)